MSVQQYKKCIRKILDYIILCIYYILLLDVKIPLLVK